MKDKNGELYLGTGLGSDTFLSFQPSYKKRILATDYFMQGDTILLHENTHIMRAASGSMIREPAGLLDALWDDSEEKAAIIDGEPSEADYLKEIGIPYHRAGHNPWTWLPNLE